MRTLIWIGSIAAALALIAAAICLMVKKTNKKAPAPAEKQPAPQPEIPADPVIAAGIGRNALRFMGLYEGIYTAVEKGTPEIPDAYREWHVRMQNLRQDEAFYQAFTAAFPAEGAQPHHLEKLMACIRAAEIRRESGKIHIADAATKDRYVYLGAGDLVSGREYLVMKPCWTRLEVTVEQGVLLPKEE